MSRKLISKTIALLNEGGRKDILESYEELIVDELEEYIEGNLFFELPTNEILKIIDKSNIEDIDQICSFISKMNENKKEESILLLNVIKADETTFEGCMKILSKFDSSPICRRTSELFDENKKLPERDNEHEISELKKEIEKLRNRTKEKKTYFSPVTEKPFDFESDIFKAAEEGKLKSVQYLVEQLHADVETKDKDGRTPINIASWNGHLKIVKYLYEACDANVEVRDNYGRTPINITSLKGHIEVVKYLYEKCYANFEAKDNYGFTPINNASLKGHFSVVKYLYEACDANIEAKDDSGSTPINNASLKGYLEVVKYLYETCHANVETRNKSGRTPIYNASLNGHLEVVKYLCETCHAKITEKIILNAKTEELKNYLLSKQQKR